ncbi:Putative phosphinothricin acetyltransferase YwnH [Mannheimia haemolytica]|uniref:Phosphinothricin acetyltransferase YwnH n=1 Tax=Mannheimia haemolytica TaxID=75985 RepID=A0A378N1M7_MANHA|nr:Putative phosphinothricin acetyltransferase YwnH [Mannheimia haemolytica]
MATNKRITNAIPKAVEADFETILAIYNQAIPTHQITADLELATTQNRRKWFDFHLETAQYPIWVVEDEKGIAGWFSFSPFYERPAFLHTSEISIYLDRYSKGKAMAQNY